MKIFFVGDNRTSVNWGRGASIALTELLAGSFEIIGTITGDYFNLSTADIGYVGTLLPSRDYKLFRYLMQNKWRRKIAWYLKLEQFCGAHDFVAEDPRATVDNLLKNKHRYGDLNRIYTQAAAADLVVVDGDGDIVFSTPPRRETLFLLAMIELGIRLNKPVFLVNSMLSDCPKSGKNEKTVADARRLMTQCKAVYLRDPESLEYAQREMPEAKSSLIPDSLFAWYPRYTRADSYPPADGDFLLPHPEIQELWGRLDFSKPYICIGGNAAAAAQPDRAKEVYGKLVDGVTKLGYRVCLTENDEPDSFLHQVALEKGIGIIPANAPILQCGAVLAHARLFISGRYHPSILASLGGTPCIFLASSAHKMGSLPRVLKYAEDQQFGAFPGDEEILEIVELAGKYLQQGEPLRARIREVAKLCCEQATKLPAFLKKSMNVSEVKHVLQDCSR